MCLVSAIEVLYLFEFMTERSTYPESFGHNQLFNTPALYEEKRSEKAAFIFSLLKTATEKQMC